ncbi:hypothetical protein HAHE_27700 [Haloferula helveola]|uniref:Uncharacterized protein n=1 Tax=Haloferula helveola TaxID=490095 RepID=A0ABM7RGD2_9BACT|nr:hypothetical protein HAHE_27700 [Haloferula helveola]
MRLSGHQIRTIPPKNRGFALVACVLLLSLLTILAVGILSLSAIELRGSAAGEQRAMARSNARLALLQAVGQLQREMGPDQRVSASADLVGVSSDRHWTGVWSSTMDDGRPYLQRDPATGTWIDLRDSDGWSARGSVQRWLVSGDGEPGLENRERIELVGSASVGSDEDGRVSAPLVQVDGDDGHTGALAWWTGDLGLRANLAVPDRHAEFDPDVVGRGTYRRMLGQHAEEGLMGVGFEMDEASRHKMASHESVELAAGSDWARQHFHDYTVASRGVFSNTREGGLKLDLSAYFNRKADGSQEVGRIRDEDPLLVDAEGPNRRKLAGPSMGVLRTWARTPAPFDGDGVQAVDPQLNPNGDPDSAAYALCNEKPAMVDGVTASNLQPILVEATNFLQISTFRIVEPPKEGYQLRHHLYPRVVLWNPYNVELKFEPAVVMIQGNGRQEMWTENEYYSTSTGKLIFTSKGQWLSFEGGRSTDFVLGGKNAIMGSDGYNDPYIGSYYFTVPQTTFGPGECLVFSPAESAEYDGKTPYKEGPYDLASNMLSCEVAPDPSRSFYVSGSDIGGGIRYRPVRFWYAPTPYWSNDGRGVINQSDDTRVVMKRLVGRGPVTYERFDKLPQLSYLSASLQYGAGREPRIAWNDQSPMDIQLLDKDDPRPTLPPDVRTRDGIRLRWFEEHQSNLQNAGPMSGNEAFFQEALFANWNPRAAYAVRSPWENIAGTMPSDGAQGSGGGPWFFGAYTRDLYDEAVGWAEQTPRFKGGRYHGNPFGPPQEGRDRHVLFELPRNETGVVSLGQLQNAKLSELVWHPSFAIGNSLADPRLGLDGLDRTVPPNGSEAEEEVGGFHPNAIGWSSDSQRSEGRGDWALHGRVMLQDLPDDELLVYDLSFESNVSIWDRYFVSSGDINDKSAFVSDSANYPLPNGRISLSNATRSELTASRLNDEALAGYHMMLDGVFNVNSTRVDAWVAMLAATRDVGPGSATPFARILNATDGSFAEDSRAYDDSAWAGFRVLTDDEIRRLAEEIVGQVRLRGPFLSLSDFVNRRLRNDQTGRSGALQAAIDEAELNLTFEEGLPLDNEQSLNSYRHPDNISDPIRIEQQLKPATLGWGAPGFLTQGDVLQVLGASLSARSDTFLVRAYGDCRDRDGKIVARAWCEAEVQRTPVPIDPSVDEINPEPSDNDFGRRFEIVSFRWLKPEEV